jgi:trehalose/maltose hydrolase-like predicted phosphorylase
MVLGQNSTFAIYQASRCFLQFISLKIIFREELQNNFEFYESFTVHESSLSHSIQAALLDKMDMAYTFYLRTSRLDLDDYNKEVEEGCHITSIWQEHG